MRPPQPHARLRARPRLGWSCRSSSSDESRLPVAALALTCYDLLNTYLESWNNYDFYLNKINNQEKIIDSLELKLQGNEILYKAQKIDITQLIESKNELNDAHNILLDLKSSKKYYLIDILILNGDLNTIINGLG